MVRGMKSAGSLLDRAIRRAGINQQVQGFRAQAVFADALEERLGPQARQQARARSLKDQTLTVVVANSALASEIQINAEALIEAVNTVLGEATVRYLRLTVEKTNQ